MSIGARQLALEALYEADQRDLADYPLELPSRAARLVKGVLENLEELDREIEAVAEHWQVHRMPVVDRAILRLGLFELRFEPDTPKGVVVSEAVRLAKLYGTERSGSFVNGVLAKLADQTRN
ncbi:MAG: transcription antitermination factor NusB [Acidimicrobiia bacterium]